MTPQKQKEKLYCYDYGHTWTSLHRYGLGEQHGRICEYCEKEELEK